MTLISCRNSRFRWTAGSAHHVAVGFDVDRSAEVEEGVDVGVQRSATDPVAAGARQHGAAPAG
jgi:hypothetical protein